MKIRLRARIRGLRSRLGRRRTEKEAEGSVNIEAIPFLTGSFVVHPVKDFAIIGDAPKNYIVYGGAVETLAYIAKKPRREGPIECVTEYLISCLGKMLPLSVAEGGLCRLPVKRGEPADVRFLSRQFLNRAAGEQLVHGSQLVARCFEMGEMDLVGEIPKGKEWQFYTVDLIDDVLGTTATTKSDHERLRGGFARMMTFDALIGANDRHPQNWGVIESALAQGTLRFSPIFDTARGLFWNHSEPQLTAVEERNGREAGIEKYANGSMPLIAMEGRTRPNHFDVIGYMATAHDGRYRPDILRVVEAFSPDATARMLHVKFRRLVSRRRLEFIDALLRYRYGKVRRVCGLR